MRSGLAGNGSAGLSLIMSKPDGVFFLMREWCVCVCVCVCVVCVCVFLSLSLSLSPSLSLPLSLMGVYDL